MIPSDGGGRRKEGVGEGRPRQKEQRVCTARFQQKDVFSHTFWYSSYSPLHKKKDSFYKNVVVSLFLLQKRKVNRETPDYYLRAALFWGYIFLVFFTLPCSCVVRNQSAAQSFPPPGANKKKIPCKKWQTEMWRRTRSFWRCRGSMRSRFGFSSLDGTWRHSSAWSAGWCCAAPARALRAGRRARAAPSLEIRLCLRVRLECLVNEPIESLNPPSPFRVELSQKFADGRGLGNDLSPRRIVRVIVSAAGGRGREAHGGALVQGGKGFGNWDVTTCTGRNHGTYR